MNRSLPEHLRNMQVSGAAIDEAKLAKLSLKYTPQKVKLYRIEDMKWVPYFSQGNQDRLVEF